MNVFSRMLIAVDGSDAATAALRFALRCAEAIPEARLRVISVFDRDKLIDQCSANPYVFSDLAGILESAMSACREAEREALDAARAVRSDASGTTITASAVGGILDEARNWAASSIVMGTRGRRGVSRAFFGSCAEGVLRQSTCPVLTTHAVKGEGYDVPRRIMCALDDSPAARQALEAATQIAIDLQCRLDLVTVAEACTNIEALAEAAHQRGIDVVVHLRGGADVAGAIVACTDVLCSDLTVLGTHGRTGIQRALLGSTAEHVIRTSRVPVLAVRDPKEMLDATNSSVEAGSIRR